MSRKTIAFWAMRHPNSLDSPVRAIETYLAIAHSIGIDLRHGFLFRPTNPKGSIVEKPLEYSTSELRLRSYL